MHIFIDTNIFLSFFDHSKDQLAHLNEVFVPHENGSATVYLTQQVCDEFKRNRENRIEKALNDFKDVKFPHLPSFMKAYDEYDTIQGLSKTLKDAIKSISEKVKADTAAESLVADKTISDIFSSTKTIPTSREVFAEASMRLAIGNPPGKKGSIGDIINWLLLLKTVPKNKDLHVISADGDFYSKIDEKKAHPFLQEEWRASKGSSLHVYHSLGNFMKQHFDGQAFVSDNEKETLIHDLLSSSSFANTHELVSKLEVFQYFSLKQVEDILNAAVNNRQFGSIATDNDVSDFLCRVAAPRMESLTNPKQLEILREAMEKQHKRGRSNT